MTKNKNGTNLENKINIAIEGRLLHRSINGTERYITELIKNLTDMDKENGYNYFVVNNSGYDTLNIPTISRISLEHKIDLYHRTYQFETYEKLSEYLIAERRVFTFLDLILCKYPDYFRNKTAYEERKTIMGLALNLSGRIIAISEHAKRDAVEMFDIPAEKVDVIYLGVDPGKFKKINNADEIAVFRKEFGLPEKYILCIGTDYPHKNMKNLLIAFAKVARLEEMKDHRLVWAGNSYYFNKRGYLNEYIEPIKDKVISLRHFDDNKINLLYNAADIFVFPSLYEGFGLPVLEAFACEVPVVCSKAASLPEVAGDAAYMVDAAEPDQLAAAIVDIVKDPELRRTLIEKGRKRSRQFTWEKCAKDTFEVYKRTLSEKQDHGPRNALNMRIFLREYAESRNADLTRAPGPEHKNVAARLNLFFSGIKEAGFVRSIRKVLRFLAQKRERHSN